MKDNKVQIGKERKYRRRVKKYASHETITSQNKKGNKVD